MLRYTIILFLIRVKSFVITVKTETSQSNQFSFVGRIFTQVKKKDNTLLPAQEMVF